MWCWSVGYNSPSKDMMVLRGEQLVWLSAVKQLEMLSTADWAFSTEID